MRRAARAAPGVERVAALVERLAVLLEAGVPPASAWRYLADHVVDAEGDRRGQRARHRDDAIAGVVVAASSAARSGQNVAVELVAAAESSAVADAGVLDAWRAVAAAWDVATETGAPLAQSLHRLAQAQRSVGQTQRDVDAALAGPRATSRLVGALPLVGLVFGLALGFDTFGTLFGTAPGVVCLAAGSILMVLAWRWSRRMVSRATPSDTAPGIAIELTAIAVASGAAVARARRAVQDALLRAGLDGSLDDDDAVEAVMALSTAAGIPAGTLLRGEAEQARRTARSEAQLVSAALATRLMLPLGVCVLPAFMLLGVAPLMLSVLSSTLGAF